MLVHIIADYGFGDPFEVVQRIKFYLPDAEPMLTPCLLLPHLRLDSVSRS